jgi:hypothetical protein
MSIYFCIVCEFSFLVLDPLYYCIFFLLYSTNVLQPRKSISFIGPVKATASKGYAGASISRLGMSRTMVVLPEMKTTDKDKMSIPTTKTIQVIFFFLAFVQY